MSKDLAQTTKDNAAYVKRPRVSDESVKDMVASVDSIEKAAQIAEEDPRVLAAAVRTTENLAEVTMKLAHGDSKLAEAKRQEVVAYLAQLSKLRHIAGLTLRHAGQKVASKDFIASLETQLAEGKFVGSDAQLVRETLDRYRRIDPRLTQILNRGILEYGIDMMLAGTDTNWRNVIGQAIGTALNPLERAWNACLTRS